MKPKSPPYRGPHPAHAQQTPDEWFALVAAIDRQYDKINNKPDRRFIKKMFKELAADDKAVPTPAQAHWLLSIKADLERGR